MIGFLIRIIVLMFLLFVLIRFFHVNLKKRSVKISFVILAIVILEIIPLFVDPVLLSFKSAESAYHYACIGNVSGVIEGKRSAMVISADNSNFNLFFCAKKNGRYKLLKAFSSMDDYEPDDINLPYEVAHVENTSDYYVYDYWFSGEDAFTGVSDSRNSKFMIFAPKTSDGIYSFATYVPDYASDYYIILNGEKIG